MFVIVAKDYISHTKFLMLQNHILKNSLVFWILKNQQIVCSFVNLSKENWFEQTFEFNFTRYIIKNEPNMKYLSTSNKIKEILIASCVTFAQIFEL